MVLQLWKLNSSEFCDRFFLLKVLLFSQYSLCNHDNSLNGKFWLQRFYNYRSIRKIQKYPSGTSSCFHFPPHSLGQRSSCLRFTAGSSVPLWEVLPAKAGETDYLWKDSFLSPTLFVMIRYGGAYKCSVKFLKNIYHIQIIVFREPGDRKCQHH